jgi:predicted PurR-regulated permease PerM
MYSALCLCASAVVGGILGYTFGFPGLLVSIPAAVFFGILGTKLDQDNY